MVRWKTTFLSTETREGICFRRLLGITPFEVEIELKLS